MERRKENTKPEEEGEGEGGERGQKDRKEKRKMQRGGRAESRGQGPLARGLALSKLGAGWAPGLLGGRESLADGEVPAGRRVLACGQEESACRACAPVSSLTTFWILWKGSFVWQINHSSQLYC